MGQLFVVPTPVGNMDDMTFRAIKTLNDVDFILAEDTRTSSVLMHHFNIKKEMHSYHKFNEHQTLQKFVDRILGGQTAALISDAGTPGISDPGFLLVRECVRNGITVQTLPGATAFVPALVSSGLPCDKFVFEGFLPQKKGRQKRIAELIGETRTIVFYESPYRVVKTLEQFREAFGPTRQICCQREISKIHEESIRGTIEEVLSHFKQVAPKGEFVIVLGGTDEDCADDTPNQSEETNNLNTKGI